MSMPIVVSGTQADRLEDVMRRIRAEFSECPGLRLTRPQAQRFWNLDSHTCGVLLDALESSRFLKRTLAGAYGRSAV